MAASDNLSEQQFTTVDDGSWAWDEAARPRTYYHGTSSNLVNVGDDLTPASASGKRTWGEGNRDVSDPHVAYLTGNPQHAHAYAKTAAEVHGGEPRVYEVEPHDRAEVTRVEVGNRGVEFHTSVGGRVLRARGER